MHPSFQALWASAASLACLKLAQAAGAGGVPEVDLVFPRNETYAPSLDMPVVFAFQNWDAELMSLLVPGIDYKVWYMDSVPFSIWKHEGTGANWSSHDLTEPYFFHNFHSKFTAEGTVRISWILRWVICGDHAHNSSGHDWITKGYWGDVIFTVKNGGRAADLEAATADNTTCTTDLGVAINITNETKEVLNSGYTGRNEGICAVVNYSDPEPTPSPCVVQVGSAAAASISASWTARVCMGEIKIFRELRPDIICQHNAACQQLAFAGVTCLAAALGAVLFLLA